MPSRKQALGDGRVPAAVLGEAVRDHDDAGRMPRGNPCSDVNPDASDPDERVLLGQHARVALSDCHPASLPIQSGHPNSP